MNILQEKYRNFDEDHKDIKELIRRIVSKPYKDGFGDDILWHEGQHNVFLDTPSNEYAILPGNWGGKWSPGTLQFICGTIKDKTLTSEYYDLENIHFEDIFFYDVVNDSMLKTTREFGPRVYMYENEALLYFKTFPVKEAFHREIIEELGFPYNLYEWTNEQLLFFKMAYK